MTKRIISLAVVAMLLVAIAIIPASAEEVVVQPRATCAYCGGYATYVNQYGPWCVISKVDCTHYIGAYGKDHIESRDCTKQSRCSTCGRSYILSEWSENRTICYGVGINK